MSGRSVAGSPGPVDHGRGDWDRAHEIVQELDGSEAARVHAYLHRKEGDDWNSRYWHRRAGSTYPADLSVRQEWDYLVRRLLETPG